MKYIVNHIPKDTPCNRRPALPMEPEYITIHSTGNPDSSAQNERNWLTNKDNTRTASYHIVVDDKGAIEVLPLNEVAYHAGDGKGTGNMKTIGIELCESGDRAKTIQNAVALTAKLLHERGWGIGWLRRHYDWSGKNCPRIMSTNNWDGWIGFKIQVERELEKLANPKQNQEVSNWAKEAWEWTKKEGLLDGTRPKDTITREEIALILFRLKNK